MLNGVKPGQLYPESVRRFCLSIHFHSPRAYEFIREVFYKKLPCKSTIQKWYSNCNVVCEPGLTQYSLDLLKNKVKSLPTGKRLIGSLSCDEVYIHKDIQWYQKCKETGQFIGLVSFGSPDDIAVEEDSDDYDDYEEDDDENDYEDYPSLDHNSSDEDEFCEDYLCDENDENGKNEDNGSIISEKDKEKAATQAIVFYFKAVNDSTQIPVAFHFIKSLNYERRAELFTEVINAVTACGVFISNITFDGLASNVKMCNLLLGAKLTGKSTDMITYFENPTDKSPIEIILDPSHMIKLIRNCLAKNKIIYDADNQKIKWQYFKHLAKFNKLGMNMCNKLNRRHIMWYRNKMNVRLAVQTFSESVATSMEYLMKKNYPEFAGATATIKFIRCFNRLFDIMNSRQTLVEDDNIYKRPLDCTNQRIVYDYFDYATKYIESLKLSLKQNTKPITESRSKCGFKGCIINMLSIKSMFSNLVIANEDIPCLPVYMLSQDHLEIFFSKIRSRNGYNDNPTPLQFISAYKRLLMHSEIRVSRFANIGDNIYKPLQHSKDNASNILKVSSSKKRIMMSAVEANQSKIILDDIATAAAVINRERKMNDLRITSITYVASIIEENIVNSDITCKLCERVFQENPKIDSSSVISTNMKKPCESTFRICKVVDVVMD